VEHLLFDPAIAVLSKLSHVVEHIYAERAAQRTGRWSGQCLHICREDQRLANEVEAAHHACAV